MADRVMVVTVCDVCLQSSCWQGIFFCEEYLHAGTVDLPLEELLAPGREHPDYLIPYAKPEAPA